MVRTQQNTTRKLFPIGIDNIRTIREQNFHYVDKTLLIYDLVVAGERYFLSRPRRFGKSLLVNTLQNLFEGREELFRGLAVHDCWDWKAEHPVVRISFGGGYQRPEDIEEDVHEQLAAVEFGAGLTHPDRVGSAQVRLRNLVRRLHECAKHQVVVLIDEYDKPILDALDNADMARANRDYLSGLYGTIKDSGSHVGFVFVTGITMFSKVNLFSGLNNLKDISLNPRYASICGFTDQEIDKVFAAELQGLDRAEVRRWYDGYHWRGEHKLYNPWDILSLLDDREFMPYWFETATPRFLYRMLAANNYPIMNLDGGRIERGQLTQFDVEEIDLRALMFQSGYLTIAEEHDGGSEYTLKYPNLEVRRSFSKKFLRYLGRDEVVVRSESGALLDSLASNDFNGFKRQVRAVLSGMSHQWFRKNPMASYEGYYLSLLYAHFNAVGADVRGEDSSSIGQADLVLKHAGQVFLMEAKLIEKLSTARVEAALSTAMNQMRERRYADKYRGSADQVHLIALVFGSEERNLLAIKVEFA